jgi:hypothetical protein
MSLNQDIKAGPPNNELYYNPLRLFDFIKPSRILVNNVNPISGPINPTGQDKDYYINSTTGDLFENTKGQWFVVYNFSTGGGGAGITNIDNVGEGIQIFKDIVGSTANFKTLVSTGNQINITPDIPIPNSITLSMSDAYKPVTLSLVNNFPLQTGLGSGTLDPNGVLGTPDYNTGSLFVQVPNTIWICQNASLKSWIQYDSETGIDGIENTRNFGGQIFRDIVGGVAFLKVIRGGSSLVVDNFGDDFIDMKVSDTYKPLTLSNIDNIKNTYGSTTAPINTDDITKGYSIGSVFTQVNGGVVVIWVCTNNLIAAATWQSNTSTKKEYASWESIGGQPQAITGIGFQDVNFGAGVPTNTTPYPGTVFTTLQDGSRQVFRRLSGEAGKAYNVTLNMSLFSNLGPTVQEALYTVRMIRKSGVLVVRQSQGGCIFPYSTINNRNNFISVSFVYQESLSGQQDYYFQISGTVGGVSANDVDIDYWTVSISEI